MRRIILDHIEHAYRNLQSNRGRSLLTTLGIAIGVASVTCILALNDGVSSMINNQVAALDGRLIVVRPGQQNNDPNAYANPIAQQAFNTSTLTESDVAAIAALDGIGTTVPLMTLTGSLTSATKTVKNYPALATTPEFLKTADIRLKAGDFIGDVTSTTSAVIGTQLSLDLFSTDKPIGQQFTMRGVTFTVVGVIERVDDPINFNNIDLNNAVIFSLERGKLFHEGRAQLQQIDVLVTTSTDTQTIATRIREALLKTHAGEEDFSVLTGASINQPTNQLYVAIMQVMTTIAAISLVVGGVGIMNIMLVNVAERTREIGIRKAVGASNGTIITQFLIESLMMSLLGGALGYLIGYVLAFVVSTFLYFAPVFTWVTAAVAAAMSVCVGVIFGLYPAVKAARKDTIESLRQYH
jgi:ABC-type antimicrobial peptide transport system permease subunit